MALTFRGTSIPGTHEAPRLQTPEPRMMNMEFFGVNGESQITGERGAREFTIRIWIHNAFTQANLFAAMNTLDGQVGKNGVLVESGNVSRTFNDCTFLGYTEEVGPLPSPHLGWISIGVLKFRQLKV